MIEAFLFLFTGIIGAITLLMMINSYKTNPFYNAFLFVIIVIISVRFIIHGSYTLQIQDILKPDKGVWSILYLVIVPCFYLYHKNLVLGNRTYSLKDLKHLIFIIVLLIINVNPLIHNSFLFYYGKFTNFILITLFVSFYVISISRILSKHIWFKENLVINDKHLSLVKNWTIYLFSINLIGAILLLYALYTEITLDEVLSGKSLALILLTSWLFIYFKILISPEILYGLPILNKKLIRINSNQIDNKKKNNKVRKNWKFESNSHMNSQDLKLQNKIQCNIDRYTSQMDLLSSNEFIFRNPKTSITDISNKLNVPASHLVYLFKYHSNISFSEYRMQSRIEDAITLVKNDYLKTNTLDSLAYKVGFSSYNPFYTAFKKHTASSPKDYINTIKK